MQVTICGPNLRDQSKGQFHIHAAGCADLVRGARREPEYRDGWTVEAATREDVVRAIYSDHIGEEERGREWAREQDEPPAYMVDRMNEPVDWHDYDDVHVFPCCTQLDG
jgi:hypothetical protein